MEQSGSAGTQSKLINSVIPFREMRTLTPLIIRASFLAIFPIALRAAEPEAVIGAVKSAQGTAVVHRGTQDIPGQEGMHLILHDVLRTSSNGRIGAILQDGTRLSLGSNTEVKIDDFVYQPVDGKFGLLLRMARGAMSYISGKISQFSPESVKVETPVGVVGLRGAHFAISLDEKAAGK